MEERMSGAKIIDALKDAAAGNLARVTVEGETWAKVKDIHADQQEIMRINNELRAALLNIKGMVVGEKSPNWTDDWATTGTRGRIADLVDSVVR
jgi:hypothetical protein